jgi:hypothetical protein
MRLKRRILIAICVLASSLSWLSVVSNAAQNGGNGPTPGGTVVNGTPEAIVVTGPGGELHRIVHTGRGRSGTWTCHYYATTAEVDGTQLEAETGRGPIVPKPKQVVALLCWDDDNNLAHSAIFVFDPADPVPGIDDPAQAAADAERLLPLRPPAIGLSPPLGVRQLVGIPTWLWVAGPWRPLRASASLGGVRSTVTATPTGVTWTLDDGTTVTCHGPGTPYDPRRPAEAQHSDCTHLFEDAGAFHLTATVTYRVAWTASTGDAGGLGPLTRASTVPIVVDQAQALIH